MNDIDHRNAYDLEKYIVNSYNAEKDKTSNNALESKYHIVDFGEILFAENDRRSKYVRIPFKADAYDSESILASSNLKSSTPTTTPDIDNMYLNKRSYFDPIESATNLKEPTAERIVALMRKGWKLSRPKLVISITGGANQFKTGTPGARYAFQRALIATAATTDAWFITGGNYAGIMKEVGYAVYKCRYKNIRNPSKIQCIGIGSWFYVTDHEYLVQERTLSVRSSPPSDSIDMTLSYPLSNPISSSSRSIPKHYLSYLPRNVPSAAVRHMSMSVERTRIYRCRSPESNEDSCSLDPNHTHFILLDDLYGKNMQFAPETVKNRINCRPDLTIKFRMEIERAIKDNYSVPIVQILNDGGPSSMLTVCEALQQSIPIIVIQGSGRAADEIVHEYEYLYGSGSLKYEEQRSIEVYEQASSRFPDFELKIRSKAKLGSNTVLNHTNCEQFIKQMTSRQGYFLISIFNFYNEQEKQFDDTIIHALGIAAKMMTSEDEHRINELKLAMAWNKFDHIQRHILTDKTIIKWTEFELDRSLCDAIQMNKIRCVDLLIECGASFDRLERFKLLDTLYQEIEPNALPYSKYMNDKLKKIQSDNWMKLDKKYFYKDYLLIDSDKKEASLLNLLNDPITNYGINNDNKKLHSSSNFHSSICVFNGMDMIQIDGYLSSVDIRFDTAKTFCPDEPLYCYLISPGNNSDAFYINSEHELISSLKYNSANLYRYQIKSNEKLFVCSGQYIAIGFTNKTGFPCSVSERNQHSLELDQIKSTYRNEKSVQFHVDSELGVAISFDVQPFLTFNRDLFLWSLFFNRYDMATYLCSKSSNTILAALIASDIYHQAARRTQDAEDRLDFIEKENNFAHHASTIMNMCFHENEQFALDLLESKSQLFFDKSPLEIAKHMNSRTFLSTKTVQCHYDQKWYGNLKDNQNSWSSINFLMFILCFIPILIPIPLFSNIFIADKRQINKWHQKRGFTGLCGRIFYRFQTFYSGRAAVRFYYNILFYIFFLTLFSFVLLVDYFPLNINGGQRNGYTVLLIPITEIFVHILIWSLILEEGRDLIEHWTKERQAGSRHIIWRYYMKDKWNILDLVAILLYLLGFLTRFIVNKRAFMTSKILMCIDLFLWYVRTLHVFIASKRLGPKLLMIFNTMKDLLFFIYFIIIFLTGYSVTSYALIITKHQVFWKKSDNTSVPREFTVLNNGTSLWRWRILREIIHWGVWKIYGQVDLKASYLTRTEPDVTVENDAYGIVAFIFTIFFVFIASILLINVLVALFNVTIQKVQHRANESSAYHYSLLVDEYSNKTFLPPPINIFYYLFNWLYKICKDCLPNKLPSTYGKHENDMVTNIDSNLFNMVVFNAEDRIKHLTGSIISMTINFKSPPLEDNPSITLYLVSDKMINSNMFDVHDKQILNTSKIQAGQYGICRIPLKPPVKCHQGQFVALGFGCHSGSPVCIKDRNEYSVNLDHFENCLNLQDKSIHFNNYPNNGAAFSFVIIPSRKNEINDENLPLTTIDSFNDPNTTSATDLGEIVKNKFEKRDNMLREMSIAEDYWKQVINEIKQKEARLVEEQNESNNSLLSKYSATD